MSQADTEKNLTRYLPNRRRVILDVVLMLVFAGLAGPLIGPFVLGFVNPTQAWGAAGPGVYTAGNVITWGLAFIMIEAILYTGWLVSRIRKGRDEAKSSSWELH